MNIAKNLGFLSNSENCNIDSVGELTENINYKPFPKYETSSTVLSTVTEVLDEKGSVDQVKLEKATSEALDNYSRTFLCEEDNINENCELNDKIVEDILLNSDRSPNGRMIMPLPWNPECKDRLGTNFNLSKKILHSNLRKLEKNSQLSLYNEVFKEQEESGVVERITDLNSFLKCNPDCSFLPHMGVFKLGRETTKVRIVYLSNLCEKSPENPNTVSHNAALLPGPCLNSKLQYFSFVFEVR